MGSLFVCASAFAQAPEMGPPKPSEEIKAVAKEMVGVWKCEGKVTMGGKDMPSSGKMVFTTELGGHFIGARFDSPKTKENPAGYKMQAMMAYDGGSKTFTRTAYDNMGGVEVATSKGWEGDKMAWSGKTRMGGMEMESKETITRKGPREVATSGSMGTGAQAVSWESSCKK